MSSRSFSDLNLKVLISRILVLISVPNRNQNKSKWKSRQIQNVVSFEVVKNPLGPDIEQMLKRKFLLFLNPVKLWLADM